MKRALILLSAITAAAAYAQDYIGTFEAEPPYPLKDPKYSKAWEMSKQRIEILPDRIVFAVGALLPEPTNITYSRQGPFLLAKQETEHGVMYYPIYVLDKDTIFAQGHKLVRIPGHIEVRH